MGLDKAAYLGILSLGCALLALYGLRKSRPLLSIFPGVGAAVFIVIACPYWHMALVDSGKDPFLLGIQRYPAVAAVIAILFVTGLACAVMGLRRITSKNRAE